MSLPSEDVYYYLRVGSFPDADYNACLSYVRSFHEATINKNRVARIADSLEPVWNADEGTFSHVDIHNSASTVCWGDLNVSEASEPVILAKEVNEVYTAFEICYPAVIETGEEKTYYDVCEYFRVRSAGDHIYLLDYDRTAEEIFTGEAEAGTTRLLLGVRSERSDHGFECDCECGPLFLQAGELWLYRPRINEFTRSMVPGKKKAMAVMSEIPTESMGSGSSAWMKRKYGFYHLRDI